MKRIHLIVLIGFFCLTETNGQQAWTLEACIDQALQANRSVQSNELSSNAQQIRLNQAKNQRLPGVYGNASQNLGFGQTMNNVGVYENRNSQTYNAGISASLNLFNGLQTHYTIQAQELNLHASMEDLKAARENLAIQVASAYLQVLYNKELHQVARTQVELSATQVTRFEQMAELGKIAEGQVYEVKAQHARNKQSEAEVASRLQLSLLDLSQLLELEDWSTFDVVVPNIDVFAIGAGLTEANAMYQEIVGNKPLIRASEYRLQSAEKNRKVAEGALYPSLSLGASYSNGYYPDMTSQNFSDQMKINARTSIGLSLSIPIFNRLDTRNNIKQSEINIKQAALNVEQAKKTLYKEVQQAWFNAKTALEQFHASEETRKQSEIAFRFAEEKFTNGRATAYEYDEARINYSAALSSSLQAKYNYVFSVKILEFYKGIPLTL
ncbi:MAG: TolC family protein [Bacteroidales bacterium]